MELQSEEKLQKLKQQTQIFRQRESSLRGTIQDNTFQIQDLIDNKNM